MLANKIVGNSKTANQINPTKPAVENEFVSDAFQTSEKDLDEVKAGMKLLGIDSLAKQSEAADGKHNMYSIIDFTIQKEPHI